MHGLLFAGLAIAGLTDSPGHQCDGESLVPLLTGRGALKRDAIFWHYPHYHPGGATPYSAIRQGDYRLVEFFEDGRTELYDLKSDLSETNNLVARMPEKSKLLQSKLREWRQSVGAQLPAVNPNYVPERSTG